MAPGDSFECIVVQKGQPLYLDRFRRAADIPGAPATRYVAGRDSGITDIAIIPDDTSV